MSDYTTKATVELDVNGQKAKQELEQQRKLVKDLETAYAKAAASGDKSSKTLLKELNKARRELKSMQSATVNVADVLRRLDSVTPKELKSTLRQLNKELNCMERGSMAWNEQVKKIHAVKEELDSVNTSLSKQQSGWDSFLDWLKNWQTGVAFILSKVVNMRAFAEEYVRAYTEMDSALANTQKFTGMTREEVELLNEEFKKMDTRTSREDLNKLAQAAGRLGKNSVEDVLGFVRAADVLGVAMDELGEDAPQVISQLARIFNLENEIGTEQAMLSVGSAINTLSQNCAASAPNLVDFAGRLGAIANSTHMTMDEMLAFGTLLDDQKVSIEKSSTAIQGVITKMYASPAEFARKAGMDADAFTEALKRSSTEGIMMFVESLSRMDQMQQAATLQNLGTAGAGVVQTFQTLAGKVDLLKSQMQTSKTAFWEATSATEEFNVQNNTVQAGLDKAKKKFHELVIALGEKLVPVMEFTISSSSAIVQALNMIVSWCINLKGVLIPLATSIAFYNVAVNVAIIKTKALAMWQGIVKTAMVTWRAVTLLTAATTALFTGNVTRATIAFKLFSTTLKLSPIGLLVGAVSGVAIAMLMLAKRTNAATEAQKTLNKIRAEAGQKLVDEKTKIELLVAAAKNETLTLDERRRAIDKLNEIVPGYNARLDDTTGKYVENKKALDEYLKSLAKKYEIEGAEELLKNIGQEKAKLKTERADLESDLDKLRKQQVASSNANVSPTTSSGAHAPGSVIQSMAYSGEIDALESKISEIDEKMEILERKRQTINDVYGNDLQKKVINTTDNVDSTGTPDNTDDNDDNTLADKFKAEQQWREREIAKARVLYATGVSDYEAYTKRMNEIEVDYFDKLKTNPSATTVERLGFEADYWEALKKQDEDALKQSVDTVERRYNECLLILKQRRAEGLMTEESYNMAAELLELEHLRKLVQCHEEGSDERIQAEQRYYDKLAHIKKQRGEEWIKQSVDNATLLQVGLPSSENNPEDGFVKPDNSYFDYLIAKQEHLKWYEGLKENFRDNVFGLNADDRQKAYDSEVKALKEVYREELDLMANNKEEQLRLEETFLKTLLLLREKYKPGTVDPDTPAPEKENAYIGAVREFDEWLKSDGGQALLGTAELVTNAMSNIFSSLSSMAQAELEIQTAAIEQRYDRELSLAEGNTYKIKRLEEKKEKEIAKAKSETSRKQYSMQVIQTIAQTAIAGLNAYSSTAAIPIVGPALAPAAMALAIATGMLQVAALKKQQQAAEAQGYASGGFTPPGGKYEPAGIVHKGEWVASQEMLASPVARPMIEALDYAQRTNTIGSLRHADVSSVIAPQVIVRQVPVDNILAIATLHSSLSGAIARLNERLDEPFVTVNTVTGDVGIKKAQDDYNKLLRNKTPKSKRKNI